VCIRRIKDVLAQLIWQNGGFLTLGRAVLLAAHW